MCILLLCIIVYVYVYFVVCVFWFFFCSFFLQYFDTVGCFFCPVKTVSHITYTVLAGRKTLLNTLRYGRDSNACMKAPSKEIYTRLIMLRSTFSGLQRCRWQFGSVFICLAVVASQICEFRRNSPKIRTDNWSRSSKVIDLGTSRKCICDFLLVKLSAKHFDMFVFLRLSKKYDLWIVHSRPGLATCLKNNSMFVSLRAFLNKPCTLQIHSSI